MIVDPQDQRGTLPLRLSTLIWYIEVSSAPSHTHARYIEQEHTNYLERTT